MKAHTKIRQGVIVATLGILLLIVTYAIMQALAVGGDTDSEFGPIERISTSASGGGVLQPGGRLPDVDLVALNGTRAGSRTKLSDFRGQPVWVNIFASWCPPCRSEMPEVEALYRELSPGGLAFVAISVEEDPIDAVHYLQTTGYTLPVFASLDGRAADVLRVTGLPTHFFLDREGIIRETRYGGMNAPTMRSKLAKIL